VLGVAMHGTLQVPEVYGHADHRHRDEHHNTTGLLHLRQLDVGGAVYGGVRRARPGIRFRQLPGQGPTPSPSTTGHPPKHLR